MDTNVSNCSATENPQEEFTLSNKYLEIIRIILACFGVLLNALTIVLLHQSRHSLRPHMRIILCLNISDLLLSVEVILFFAIKNGPSEFIHCIKFLLKSFETINVLVLMLTLLLIAADQCVATLKPIKYRQIVTVKRTNITLISVWLLSFLTVAAGTVLSTVHKDNIPEINVYSCFGIKRQYTFFINAALCVMTSPIFLGLYFVIYRHIRKLRGRDSLRGRRLSTKKATLTTLILILPLIVIYFPVSIYTLVLGIFEVQIDWPFWDIFMVFVALHTNSDPIICAVRFKYLRDRYKVMCRALEKIN